MLQYLTAGESHGKSITTVVSGLPAGLEININLINSDLRRRRLAAGRGPRMSKEADRVEITSGLRHNKTIGTPITAIIPNRRSIINDLPPLTQARPGHIDMAGAMKLLTADARLTAERASARETVGRVAAGAIAKHLLRPFDIHPVGYVINIMDVGALPQNISCRQAIKLRDSSPFYTLDKSIITRWSEIIKSAARKGDTVGGAFEVTVFNCPVGLGDHTRQGQRLDARIASEIMAIPAVKGVEIGLGFGYPGYPGSASLDRFVIRNNKPVKNSGYGWKRQTNYAGGIEGGLSNGEDIVIRGVVKPIPTLRSPLPSIDLRTKRQCLAQVESTDICAVPAAAIIAESVVAFEIAASFMDKFGADTIAEVKHNYQNYLRLLKKLF